ncbi:hypothetical protein MPSEU_000475100 [Mayamaea pseudoterrestris]|nr:hypothetical protein MPSEU_000475100 [Mayamaea pseudoterrestris]
MERSNGPRNTNFLIAVLRITLLFTCSHAFAAKRKPTKKTASTPKGFGSAPLTFADVVKDLRTRLPDNAESLPCPCRFLNDADDGTTDPRTLYKDCCQLFHLGARNCTRPLDVLRSRYSAFAYRLIPYVISTTHSTCRDYQTDKIGWARSLHRNGMFDSFEFVGLEHGKEHFDGDTGAIEFKVRLRDKNQGGSDYLSGKESVIAEKSLFLKSNDGVWRYASGDVRTAATGDALIN